MNILKKLIPEQYKKTLKDRLGVPSLRHSLQQLLQRNFTPSVILDVGAFEGNWTLEVLDVFSSAKILMIEAQTNKEPYLKNIADKNPSVDYSISLVSAEDGLNKLFRENETDSKIMELTDLDNLYARTTQTIDTIVEQKNFPYPDFIKLDVQGHELEAMKGAEKSLNNAEVCLLEVSLINIGDNSPLLAEVIAFMDKRNFQAFDISQFMRRPFDNALFQIDMFFAKKSSPLVSTIKWT